MTGIPTISNLRHILILMLKRRKKKKIMECSWIYLVNLLTLQSVLVSWKERI